MFITLPLLHVSSFSANEIYTGKDSSPIKEDVVVELHPVSGQVIRKWGSNTFYMPHGLTIDSTGCFWLTDVALHQVFKFTPNNTKNASMILGERFIPGSDFKHFCKPTSVAVHSKSKDVYVADGYCNHRVIKFNSRGEFIKEYAWQTSPMYLSGYELKIPHKIVLIEEVSSACVANRENGSIVCFNINSNTMEPPLILNDFNGYIYSISYAPCSTGLIFAVDGPAGRNQLKLPPSVFAISLQTKRTVTKFGSKHWANRPVSFHFWS